MNNALGTKLRALRTRKGLTLRDAAKEAGLDRGNLSKLEKGGRSVYTPTLYKLAKAYEVDVEDLLALVDSTRGKGSAPSTSTRVPETLGAVLELRGATTKHLADENLYERLDDVNVSVDEIVKIAREVAAEVEAIGSFFSEELEKVPRYSQEYLRVTKLRGEAYERHLWVRLKLAERVGTTWSYVIDEDVEHVRREGLEAEHQLFEKVK